jgi:D-inositol-3-phosphate glycosyltransferase
MRIAMISYHTCPLASQEGKETGGMNIYVLELSRALAQLGHQVDIFTRSTDPSHAKVVEVEEGLRVVHVAAGPETDVPKKEMVQYTQEFLAGTLAWIKERALEYQVVHAHYYLSGLVAMKLCHRLKPQPKLVVNFHTLALMKNLVARSVEEAELDDRLDAELKLVKEVDAIISPSESDAAYLQFLYQTEPSKIHSIPPGIDHELFRPINRKEAQAELKLDPQNAYILFVGRVEPLKGIDVLFYALKVLLTRRPKLNPYLLIVGGDITQSPELWSQELKKLAKLRRILGIQHAVEFRGQQPQSILPYYYNSACVVAMPSHYESFGMAALEAMACGTPVIATNVAGVSSLIDHEHNSLITTANNPLLLADQLEQILLQPKAYATMKQNLMRQVDDLRWDTIAKRIVSEVYQD